MEIEENPNNPEIKTSKKIVITHYFLIKYKNDMIRRKFADLVNKLIVKHELKNFHVEEKQAFLENRIKYNQKTLTKDVNINFEKLNEIFLEHFED